MSGAEYTRDANGSVLDRNLVFPVLKQFINSDPKLVPISGGD